MSGILIREVEYEGQIGDILVHEAIGVTRIDEYDHVINGKGLIAVPAFKDEHVHFRDPGFTDKEDLCSGAKAAAAGGYSVVRCEPNTQPVIDNSDRINAFEERVDELGIPIFVCTKCALTIDQLGKELVDIRGIKHTFDFSSDGEPVTNHDLLVEAFRQSAPLCRIHLHCEETPRTSEQVRAVLGEGLKMAREPELIRLALSAFATAGTGRLHIQHVSLAESVSLIADAKQQDFKVTAEVTPHHLLLCEDNIPLRNGERDPNWKMNPPLRSREDMLAIRRALADGVIDFIATDHAPHTPAEKAKSWDEAPFGVIGLETAFGACMSLVHAGELTFERLIRAMANEDSIWYDVTLIDPNAEWSVDPKKFYSKSRNCPFAGMKFKGKPVYTIANGKLVMAEGEVLF